MSVKSSEIDKAVKRASKNLSRDKQTELFNQTDKVWFRQYAKKSKEQLSKILKKVKKGVMAGKYKSPKNIEDGDEDKEHYGFEMPKQKKEIKKKKKSVEKKKKEPVEKKKKLVKKKVKLTRAEKVKKAQIIRRAPSGRVYSATELREGVGSKRAIAYRKSKNIDVKDFSKIR